MLFATKHLLLTCNSFLDTITGRKHRFYEHFMNNEVHGGVSHRFSFPNKVTTIVYAFIASEVCTTCTPGALIDQEKKLDKCIVTTTSAIDSGESQRMNVINFK